MAEKVSDPTSKVIVLSQVATVTQGPPGLLDQAVAVAQGIEPLAYLGHNIADILIQIAAALAAAGDNAAGVQETADPRCAQTVGDIARTLAAGVVRVKDFKFLDRVVAVAQEIDGPGTPYGRKDVDVLGQIVTALAATAVKTKDSKLFDQAATVAQGIGRPECKADALSQIAAAMAAAAVNTKDSKLLDQAVGVAQKIDRPAEEANALRQIANTLVTAGDKAKAGMLLDRAAAVAEGIGDPADKANALYQTATALATINDRVKASKLLDQAVPVAKRIDRPDKRKLELLCDLSQTRAFLGDLRAARRTAQGLPIHEESRVLASILKGWAENSAATAPTASANP